MSWDWSFYPLDMIMSWRKNVFRITGNLLEEYIGLRRFTITKSQLCGALLFLCCNPEQSFEQTIKLPVILGVIALMWRHCNERRRVQQSTPTIKKAINGVFPLKWLYGCWTICNIKNRKLSWCQLCRYWQHRRLFWQPVWCHQWWQSCRADSKFALSQRATLLCNDVSHWLGANLESVMSWHYADSRLQSIIRLHMMQ